MDRYRCCICGEELNLYGRKRQIEDFYCKRCFAEWAEDIKNKAEWVRYLKNLEQQRRRTPHPPVVYLGDKYDISPDGKRIPRDGCEDWDWEN